MHRRVCREVEAKVSQTARRSSQDTSGDELDLPAKDPSGARARQHAARTDEGDGRCGHGQRSHGGLWPTPRGTPPASPWVGPSSAAPPLPPPARRCRSRSSSSSSLGDAPPVLLATLLRHLSLHRSLARARVPTTPARMRPASTSAGALPFQSSGSFFVRPSTASSRSGHPATPAAAPGAVYIGPIGASSRPLDEGYSLRTLGARLGTLLRCQ